MKYKVSELEGALLNAAVAKAEGTEFRLVTWHEDGRQEVQLANGLPYRPCSAWSVGGPILERERIATFAIGNEYEQQTGWVAVPFDVAGYGGDRYIDVNDGDGLFGPTKLIAGMRAFVYSRLGPEIEL